MGLWDLLNRRKKVKLSESADLLRMLEQSGTARRVSKNRALGLSTVFACIRLLSETVGTLPCPLYRRKAGGGKIPAYDHPLYPIIHDSPNADFTSVDYWERVVADLCGWGNHYSEIIRSGGKIVALNPLKPALMSAGRDATGKPVYEYSDPYSTQREIPQEHMFHVRGFGTSEDDLLGLSPLQYAQLSLEIAISTDETAAGTYRNGMRPSGVLSTERTLTDQQREDLRQMLAGMAGGPLRAGGVIALEAGYTYSQISINPVDAQMLENRAFNVEDLCRFYRVPPYLVGHTEKSTSWGSGLEQQNIAFDSYTLRPYLSRIEKAISKWLLSPAERFGYVAEFNMEGLLRADSAARAAFYASGAQNAWLTRNEIRAKENLAPVPGGDILTAQTNLAPLEQLGAIHANGT